MKLLMSKLIELKEQEKKESLDELKGDYSQITWGSQIRSYVFIHIPWSRITGPAQKSGMWKAVMDGDIDYS